MSAESPSSGFISRLNDSEGSRRAQTNDVKYCNPSINKVIEECRALDFPVPPLYGINRIGSNSVEHFVEVMCQFFEEITTKFELSQTSRLVDFGSGFGRLAIPFLKFLGEQGAYLSLDVDLDGLSYQRSLVGSSRATVSIEHIRSRHNYYRSNWSSKIKDNLEFPALEAPDFDFSFAISVFTHLDPRDMLSSLIFLSSSLRTGGLLFASFFIIDESFFEMREVTGDFLDVSMIEEGVFHAYSGQDTFFGYSFNYVSLKAREAGLSTHGWEPGNWSGKRYGVRYQDFLIFRKA